MPVVSTPLALVRLWHSRRLLRSRYRRAKGVRPPVCDSDDSDTRVGVAHLSNFDDVIPRLDASFSAAKGFGELAAVF
ncbi:hypothetical protein [Bythopirellula polymerisocia]|uniref:hypothetical protein n=1 Tax=Bythopirellula polymerisocia TaxID=2528003 RepID=UPI0011B365A8|nr:hypothetical protein [Bythopirellula polymerisocia]